MRASWPVHKLCHAMLTCLGMQEAADDGGDLAFANALDLGAAPLGYDRLDDDWTLSAQHAPNILGGQVLQLYRSSCQILRAAAAETSHCCHRSCTWPHKAVATLALKTHTHSYQRGCT